jgi:glycosyltransferase involved in cell wall biosynthesis
VQALNTGILAARYDLIARLDDDDAWLPGKIEKQLARFAEDQDLTIISTGMRQVFESGQPSQEHIRPDGWPSILRFFCDIGCPFVHGSIIARKDIFRLLGGYPQTAAVRHCEDYALWSIWVRFFKPGMIEEVLYDYTVSATSVSSVNAKINHNISVKIQNDFKSLDINNVVFLEMTNIAAVLGVSLLQAGVACYRLWFYRAIALLPKSILSSLSVLLTDRSINVLPSLQPDVPILHLEDLIDGFGLPISSLDPNEMVVVAVA